MLLSFLEHLACPMCKRHPLKANVRDQSGDDLLTGSLECTGCGRSYSVRDGIPYLLPDALRVAAEGDQPGDANIAIGDKSARDDAAAVRSEAVSVGERYDRRFMVPDSLGEILERMAAFDYLGETSGWLLDIGAGTCRAGIHAARVGTKVLSLDLRPGQVRFGLWKANQAGLRNLQVAVADARYIPAATGHWDAAICLSVVEHIPEQRELVFRDIFRCLRDGGKAVVNVWNVYPFYVRRVVGAITGKTARVRRTEFRRGSFYRFFSPAQVVRMTRGLPFRERTLFGSNLLGLRFMRGLSGRCEADSLEVERRVRNRARWLSVITGHYVHLGLRK